MKKDLLESLNKIENCVKETSLAREKARELLYEQIKANGPVTFPDSLYGSEDEEDIVDALETHSDGVVFIYGTGPAAGLIQNVEKRDDEAIHVTGVLVAKDVDGKAPRFDVSLDDIVEVEAVIRFVEKFSKEK